MSLPMWLLWIYHMTCGLWVKQASSLVAPAVSIQPAPAGNVTTAPSWSALPQKPDMSADIVTNTGPCCDVRRKQTRPITQNGQGVPKPPNGFTPYVAGKYRGADKSLTRPDRKKKTIERSPFFVRRGGHCCRGGLVGRTTF